MLLPLGDAARDYALVATLKLVAPYDIRAMNDVFQEARLIGESKGVGTVRVTYHPFRTTEITGNRNWRRDDNGMVEYLRPRPAANWDPALRAQILIELKSQGIDPQTLDDKTLVERVSQWAMRRSQSNSQFGLWMVAFRNGKATIPPRLKAAFWAEEPKGKSLQWVLDRELFGKGMVQNRTHGACTSSSTYLATILRAVGIPTRIVVTVPLFDANDPKQAVLVRSAVRHHRTLKTILSGNNSGGFANHLFNEVWVGRKWVRLNYDRLGQPILDRNYEGLMTHVLTATDVSEIPFATTWGPRYALNERPKLSSQNPYQLVALKEYLPPAMPNPPVPTLTTATITRVLRPGDASLPSWVHLGSRTDALLMIREWLPDENYEQLRDFEAKAGRRFLLRAAGRADIAVELSGDKFSSGDGTFQGFGVHFSGLLEHGVTYALVPDNTGHKNRWRVADGAKLKP